MESTNGKIIYEFKRSDTWCIRGESVFFNGSQVFEKHHVERYGLLYPAIAERFERYSDGNVIQDYYTVKLLQNLMELIGPSLSFEHRLDVLMRFNDDLSPLLAEFRQPMERNHYIVIRPEYFDKMMSYYHDLQVLSSEDVLFLYDHSLYWIFDQENPGELMATLTKKLSQRLPHRHAIELIRKRPEILTYNNIIQEDEMLTWVLERTIDDRTPGPNITIEDITYGFLHAISDPISVARYMDLLYRQTRFLDLKAGLVEIVAYFKCIATGRENISSFASMIYHELESQPIVLENLTKIKGNVMTTKLGDTGLPICITSTLHLIHNLLGEISSTACSSKYVLKKKTFKLMLEIGVVQRADDDDVDVVSVFRGL